MSAARPRARRRALAKAIAVGALLAAAALAPPGARAASEGDGDPPPPIVTAVELRGVHRVSAEDLAERIATQESDRRPGIPIVGPVLHAIRDAFGTVTEYRLDPDALAVDRRRIAAYYRERGFYGAEVVDASVLPEGRGRVRVVFRVDEGEPTRVARLEVAGLEDAPDAAARIDRLPLREGDVFTEAAYDATRGLLLSVLRNGGWANAEVVQEARVLPEEREAIVRYEVDPGRRYRFGPIFVAGTSAVSRDRIREQAAIEIRPGQWFAEDRLARAQARVFELGVFGGVRVTRGTPDPQRGIIPIVVAVREAPFRTLRFGPGIGVEAGSRWDLNGSVGWTHRNFFGDLRRLQLGLRGGYAWLITPGKDGAVTSATVEYAQPGAITRRIDTAARLEVERGLEQAYDFWSYRARIGFPLRLARRWTVVPSYNLEVYQLSDTVSDPNRPELQNCQGRVCLLSYLEQRVGWDGRDDPVNTRRGLFVFLAVQEGFNLGGYGYRYVRLLPEARAFLPLGPRLVVAARTRVGALIPVNETGSPPIVARFTAGGPQSMRGYYTGRLSPMILQDGAWVPVGGNGLADGSLELRYALSSSWGGALFVDAGNVSRPEAGPTAYQSALDPTLLQWAVGVGLRYRTPFGPLRLDVGVQVPTDLASDVPFTERFPTVPSIENPGPGVPATHREPWIAIHLSIGEAF